MNKRFALRTAACFAIFAAVSAPATAALIVNNSTLINNGFGVSNTDLLQTSLSSVISTGNFSREGEQGVAALTDGNFGGQGNQGGGGGAATADGTNTLTYILNGGATGFDLQTVATYAGWDSFRGGQSYTLWYATVAAPSVYNLLATVRNNPTSTLGNVNSRAVISDSTGILAHNVASLRFNFGNDLTFGYAGYREIDVIGVASSNGLLNANANAVPEPSSMLLGLLALGGLAPAGRRRVR